MLPIYKRYLWRFCHKYINDFIISIWKKMRNENWLYLGIIRKMQNPELRIKAFYYYNYPNVDFN